VDANELDALIGLRMRQILAIEGHVAEVEGRADALREAREETGKAYVGLARARAALRRAAEVSGSEG